MTNPHRHLLAGVYVITCLPLQKTYIGASSHVRNRIAGHKARLRTGTHPIADLQADFTAYGEGAFDFEISQLYESHLDAVKHEQTLLANLAGSDSIYNTVLPPVAPKRFNTIKPITDYSEANLLQLARACYPTDKAFCKALQISRTSLHRLRNDTTKKADVRTLGLMLKIINANYRIAEPALNEH